MKLICVLMCLCFTFSQAIADPTNPKKIKVVIDAGHGGKDGGAQLNSILEKAKLLLMFPHNLKLYVLIKILKSFY